MRTIHTANLSALITCFLVTSAGAADPPALTDATKQYNLGSDHTALAGYDPVSYFKGGPVDGDAKITTTLNGVIYRFANEDNRKAFLADPAKYKPAYGGWCATAMADGRKVEVDPHNYKITNGRLFLFFKAWYANAQTDWNKDEKGNTGKADSAWKKLAGE